MTFFSYLKSKQRLLIFYFLFHCFALFVNAFEIEGDITNRSEKSVNIKDFTTTHLFTTIDGLSNKKPSSQFWPIVSFYKSDLSKYPDYNNKRYDFSTFNGIFYQYDISEFLAYWLLLLLILYLRWSSKDKKGDLVEQVNTYSTKAQK